MFTNDTEVSGQKLDRRELLSRGARLSLALSAPFAGASVFAQNFLEQAVTMVVPFPPGGTTDLVARIAAEGLTDRLKQTVKIDNRPGSGGNVAGEFVVRAKPDGLTVLLAPISVMAVNQYIYPKMAFSPEKDLVAVGLIARLPNVLLVPASSPIRTVEQLTSQLKKLGLKMNYGSPGIGTSPHLAGELMKFVASVKVNHTPYRGAAAAMADLVAGKLDFMFDNLPTALPQIQSGKVRALAVTSERRSPQLPDTPTMQDAGVVGYHLTSWMSLAVSSGTPSGLVDRLGRALSASLATKVVKDKLIAVGAEPATGERSEMNHFLTAERRKWSRLVKTAGIRAEQ
jgi:tripartite-type tricarboxylate transporter receptor subunit TctC